jgi:hypothetical protein
MFVKPALKPVVVARWILKPTSLLELSVQLRFTWVLFVAIAVRFEGAAGAVSADGVVTLAVLDQVEFPAVFLALTR